MFYFKYLRFICAFFFLTTIASEKVLIMTYVYSRPDFIELHDKTFKAFLKDDYEYVVFNDAPNNAMKKKIEDTCKKLGVRCFRVPDHAPNRQQPGSRHIDGIYHSLNLLGYDHNGITVMIDADMFLIEPFSISEYMKGYDLIAEHQERSNNSITVNYIAPLLVFMNMQTLPNKRNINFEGGHIHGLACDVGGHMFYYFKDNSFIKKKLYKCISTYHLPRDFDKLSKLGYDKNKIDFIFSIPHPYNMEFHFENKFVHYYAGGSNWPGYSAEYNKEKTRRLTQFINNQLEFYLNKT